MKKLLLILLGAAAFSSTEAQFKMFKKKPKAPASSNAYVKPETTPAPKKDFSKIDLSKRAADHLMLQFGSATWIGQPDSARTTGFSRFFNAYFMLDKPLKSNPYYSLAYGIGFGSTNIFFDKVNVQLAANSSTLPFSDVSGTNNFHKYKLTTIYVQAPIEIRYYSNPENPNHSWKLAAGVKVGTLLKAYTKGKDLQDKNGATIYGTGYIEKVDDNKFINSIIATGGLRIGYGNFSLHGDFQLTPVLKSGAGFDIHTLSIGLTVSGL